MNLPSTKAEAVFLAFYRRLTETEPRCQEDWSDRSLSHMQAEELVQNHGNFSRVRCIKIQEQLNLQSRHATFAIGHELL